MCDVVFKWPSQMTVILLLTANLFYTDHYLHYLIEIASIRKHNVLFIFSESGFCSLCQGRCTSIPIFCRDLDFNHHELLWRKGNKKKVHGNKIGSIIGVCTQLCNQQMHRIPIWALCAPRDSLKFTFSNWLIFNSSAAFACKNRNLFC